MHDAQDRMLIRTALCTGGIVLALGLTMMGLWFSGVDAPPYAPWLFQMKIGTAFGLIWAGAGLIAAEKGFERYARIGGGVLCGLGGLTLLQYVTGLSLGIDQAVLRDFHYPSHPYPGRMSPGSASAFLLFGTLLLLSPGRRELGRRKAASMELLSILTFVFGAQSLAGHLYGAEFVFSWGSYAQMAPHTSAAFCLLGVGMLALVWQRERARVARIPLWVPGLLCLVIVTIDIVTPRGFASGIAYIPLVFCGMWFTRGHATFVFAAVATVLAVFGLFAKDGNALPLGLALINRALTIGAVWLVAVMIYLQHRSRAALEGSRNRQAAIFNHVIDGLVSIDERGTIEEFNPACERIFGYKAAEVVGRNVKMLMPEPYHGEHDGYLARYSQTGERRIIGTAGREVSGRRKDGSTFPIDLSITDFMLDDGRHFTATIRDITERKAAEEERRRYTSALEQSNRELDEFAHIASHDLKEPLRGLFNNATFLLEDNGDKLEGEAVRRLNRIQFLSQRLERLINDLLYFSRLGRQELAVQSVDLNEEIRDIEIVMEESLKEHNARILVPRPLPNVTCDRPRVGEVFRNLIENAIKYNNSETKYVEIGCISEKGYHCNAVECIFYVKDNGIGIEAMFYDDIFCMFKRLNIEDDSVRGTGAGLTFVRKIILRHGGRIWVDSTPGKGTTFFFTLAPEVARAAAA